MIVMESPANNALLEEVVTLEEIGAPVRTIREEMADRDKARARELLLSVRSMFSRTPN